MSTTAIPQVGYAVHNARGQMVGCIELDESGAAWLVKRGLDPAKHQLLAPPAWCIAVEHLELLDAMAGKCGGGVVLHLVDGTTLTADLEVFAKFGFRLDRGHGEQVALPLARWTVHAPNLTVVESVAHAPARAPQPVSRAHRRRRALPQLRLPLAGRVVL